VRVRGGIGDFPDSTLIFSPYGEPVSRPAILWESSRPPLVRRSDDRVIAGVCDGVARHLGLGALPVRAAFVVLTAFGGAGIMAYALLWAFMPHERSSGGPPAAPPLTRGVRDRAPSIALLFVALGVLILLAQLDVVGGSRVLVPLLLAGSGVALIWRQVDEGRRPTDLRGWLLLGAGAALVLSGLVAFLALSGQLVEAWQALTAILLIVVALAVVTAPWWRRLVTELSAERRERIRTQERAEVAAHLHDSVLQTLSLIQRHVDSPREVARLARGQERELRTWLYGRTTDAAQRFAAAMEAVAADVEDTYAMAIEAVVVGDCAMDAATGALVRAAREALVNAARHSGVETVSLYAEVEAERVVAYVRDRGSGFDPETVPADRQGIRGSIEGRMARHGGRAVVRSAPGSGTEVELGLDRAGASGARG